MIKFFSLWINSSIKYLILGYIFMGIGIYFVLLGREDFYELLLIVSLTQFAIYGFKKWQSAKNN